MTGFGDTIRIIHTDRGTKVFLNNAELVGLQDIQVDQSIERHQGATYVNLRLVAKSVIFEEVPDFVVQEED